MLFHPGETSKNFSVQVYGATVVEPTETLIVKLKNAFNCFLHQKAVIGTIQADD